VAGSVKAFLDFEKKLLEALPREERATAKPTDISGASPSPPLPSPLLTSAGQPPLFSPPPLTSLVQPPPFPCRPPLTSAVRALSSPPLPH
jgi:hypothetical protein